VRVFLWSAIIKEMATYKVLQDIEAEDKLLGPLTLRQFIYGGIAASTLYLCFFLTTHGAGFLSILFLPVAFVTGFFAFPWGRDQPTEIWALAKIRFLLKPRRRIWNQSGIKELVTVTAPKHVEVQYTNGLSEFEVHSRLRALADTIDSRGWAVKNANVNLYGSSPVAAAASDRLITPASLPQPVTNIDIQASDDILDEQNNAGAHRLDTMITQSAKMHRERLLESLQNNVPAAAATPAPQQNNYWFLNQPSPAAAVPNNMVTFNTQVVTPGMRGQAAPSPASTPATDEASIVAALDAHKSVETLPYGNLHTIQPLSAMPPVKPAVVTPPTTAGDQNIGQPTTTAQPAVTPKPQTAILQLARNDDLNVATIAREAERQNNEVVIKLH
jgi:hypothetical protein